MRSLHPWALACLLLTVVSAANLQKRGRRALRSHTVHHVHHKTAHAKKQIPMPQGWSMPPLTKIFRGSEKTAGSLESNMAKLKESVNDLRKKDLDDAKEVYAQFVQALSLDDEQNQKLQANNEEDEKKIDALALSNSAEAVRRDNLVKENQKLYKQLEELKKTVNSQVNGLEDILKEGGTVHTQVEPAATVATPAAATNFVAPATQEYCHCTKACTDMGWGPWCPVQSANCITKTPCATGGAAGSCVTLDAQAGPWTRCQNIIQAESIAANFVQVSSQKAKEDDDDADDDKEDDKEDDDDEEADVCQCKQPCTDLGWGMWCYVQSATCKVKSDCDMGGAANNCVASDPAGPWTRCSNLLPAPKANSAAISQAPQTIAAATSPAQFVNADITANTKPVKDVLMKMMTQVDDIRQQDEVSMEKLRELYQQETKREASVKEQILAKKEELANKLHDVKDESIKLATEVDHLEEVNRNLHTQLRRLEHFLASASTELKGSMDTDDRMAAAAIQVSKRARKAAEEDDDEPHHKKMSKKDDDDDDDDDSDDDDDDSKDE